MVVFQELLGVIAALADALTLEGEPGAALVDDVFLYGKVKDVAFAGNAFSIHDVEFGFAERGCDLVFDDLRLRAVPNDGITIFDGGNAPHVQTHRGIELQRTSARGRFR